MLIEGTLFISAVGLVSDAVESFISYQQARSVIKLRYDLALEVRVCSNDEYVRNGKCVLIARCC